MFRQYGGDPKRCFDLGGQHTPVEHAVGVDDIGWTSLSEIGLNCVPGQE